MQHNDRHVVKMVLESAQLLSTAHRVIDGMPYRTTAPSGKIKSIISLPGERVIELTEPTFKLGIANKQCYLATHVNHPCARWVRESRSNYDWLFQLMLELDVERRKRFNPAVGKTVREFGWFLARPPGGLQDIGFTEPAQAMPEHLRGGDPVEAYRRYYRLHKQHLAKWSRRERPSWFSVA